MLLVKAEETSVVIYQSITKVEFPGLLSSNFYLYIILCVYLPLGRFSRTLDSTMSHRVFKTFSLCHMEKTWWYVSIFTQNNRLLLRGGNVFISSWVTNIGSLNCHVTACWDDPMGRIWRQNVSF